MAKAALFAQKHFPVANANTVVKSPKTLAMPAIQPLRNAQIHLRKSSKSVPIRLPSSANFGGRSRPYSAIPPSVIA